MLLLQHTHIIWGMSTSLIKSISIFSRLKQCELKTQNRCMQMAAAIYQNKAGTTVPVSGGKGGLNWTLHVCVCATGIQGDQLTVYLYFVFHTFT